MLCLVLRSDELVGRGGGSPKGCGASREMLGMVCSTWLRGTVVKGDCGPCGLYTSMPSICTGCLGVAHLWREWEVMFV